MRKQFLIVVLTIMFSYTIYWSNQTSVVLARSIQTDQIKEYEKLTTAPIFSIGEVGYVPQISESELALRSLLNESNAIELLRSLLSNAKTLPGKMYALYGLYTKDREVFKQELRRYKAERKTEGVVNTQSGCVIMPLNEDVVLSRIDIGGYDLLFKGSSTRQSN